ncbi:MAG: helix-turn-helix domain-containing protein [Deltaproteobacteria bacterium]
MEQPAKKIGYELKRIRLEKGISLDEVHRQTHIHLDVLKAIEDDNFVDISPVYLKGFLKIYCQFLGVQVPDVIAEKKHTQVQVRPQIKPSARPQEERPREQKETPAPVRPRQQTGPDPLRAFLISLALALIVTLAGALVFFAGRAVVKGLRSMKHNDNPRIVRMKKEKLAAGRTKPKAGTARDISFQEAQGLRLGIRALEDCWLQLKVDNRTVFQNILKKGRFESWEANNRMDLVLGSAGGVQMEINGKIIPPLGKRGQVLKDVVITRREGLRVGR